jgi:hypothetical protein
MNKDRKVISTRSDIVASLSLVRLQVGVRDSVRRLMAARL